jgi:hypothetical protein
MSKTALVEHVARMEFRNEYWHFGGKKSLVKNQLEYKLGIVWEGKIVTGN